MVDTIVVADDRVVALYVGMRAAHVPEVRPPGCLHEVAAGAAIPGMAWRDGQVVIPPPTTAALAPRIREECTRRVSAALDNKRDSLNSYVGRLNGLVAIGRTKRKSVEQALTAEQFADLQLLWEIDDWEGRMIDAREALITRVDISYADDGHWPPPPAGLTATWLKGF